MMNVGIITFHFVNNFGGALQAYALKEVIKKYISNDVCIVDYRNGFIQFTDLVRMFPITTDIKEIIYGIKTVQKRILRKNKFVDFQNQYQNLTQRYNKSKLEKSLNVDTLICGSDQIWNPGITLGMDPVYFLGFRTNAKKLSYAASIGVDNISNKNKMKEYLNSFDAISVREFQSILFMKSFLDKKIYQMIDPTFLLDIDEWNKIAVEPDIEESYILLYVMQPNKEIYKYAKEMKIKYNLQIVEISRYGYKRDFIDKVFVDVGPQEFVGLFKNATYICTNSYHGLAFSLIYRKKFCLIKSKKFGIRMSSLYELFRFSESNALLQEYSEDEINSILIKEKNKAVDFLKANIN